MSRMTQHQIWREMARRKKRFHLNENWQDLRLWGLFNWGDVSQLIKKGMLLTNYRKEHKIIWVWPTKETYHKHIEPLLNQSLEQLESGY